MNNISMLFNRLLADVSQIMNVRICAPHDIDMEWILKEGPRLDKELLMWLESGGVPPTFPDWLSPLSDLVSTRDPQGKWIDAIRALRQILVFGYKAEYEPTYEQQLVAQATFVETDNNLDIFDRYYSGCKGPFVTGARSLISRIIAKCDWLDITPKHGPGAVYPPSRPSQKSKFDYYPQIDAYYPYYEYFAPVSSQVCDAISMDKSLKSVDKIQARLTAVPKDSRGPRLICVHPKEAVWIQQGLRTKLESAIESNRMTRGRINFRDQTVNQMLALTSSSDGRFATIDLKDASDRISLALFRDLFGHAAQYFECCRASEVRLFDGSSHVLRKYAPMGNATTFPVEALIFWALVRSGIQCRYGEICDDIYVFGDDIIVPTKFYDGAMQALIRGGLIPNASKCFHRGLFRESCGVDALMGFDITPVRLKKHAGQTQLDLISLADFAKNLRVRGYEETATSAYNIIRKRLGTLPLSNNPRASGIVEFVDWGLGRLSANQQVRWDADLHMYVTRHLQVNAVLDDIGNNHDWNHVLDSLSRLERGVISDRGLEYALPYRTRCKYGWTPALFSRPGISGSGSSLQPVVNIACGALSNEESWDIWQRVLDRSNKVSDKGTKKDDLDAMLAG